MKKEEKDTEVNNKGRSPVMVFLDNARKLPDKKAYFEFIAAVLTVPVLITVLISNFNNLSNKKTNSATPTQVASSSGDRIVVVPGTSTNTGTPATNTQTNTAPTTNQTNTPATSNIKPAPSTECKKEVGPVEIISPTEGSTVTDNPLNIDISYNNTAYCAVVWSYRIDGGAWSDFSSKSISIFNLPPGNKKIDLRVRSIVSDNEVLITRNFIYKSDTSVATSSASQ